MKTQKCLYHVFNIFKHVVHMPNLDDKVLKFKRVGRSLRFESGIVYYIVTKCFIVEYIYI